MATFKALVKKEKMRKDKTWKVLILFTHGLKVAYLPTTMYTRVRDKKKFKRVPVVPFFPHMRAEHPACCQRSNKQ